MTMLFAKYSEYYAKSNSNIQKIHFCKRKLSRVDDSYKV